MKNEIFILLGLVLIIFAIINVTNVYATDITRQEVVHQNEKIEKKIESNVSNISELNYKLATNTACIQNLEEQLKRINDILDKIFLTLLTSVIAAIIGGGGIGFAIGKRKK